MENKIFDRISELFNTPFPKEETFDAYLDKVIPLVRSNSGNLKEEHFYTNKSWVEVQGNENFHELVFHFFSPKPKLLEDGEAIELEYLKSTDGEVWQGKWRYVENKIFIGDEDYQDTKVYELAFLDNEFMILKLLANPKKFIVEKKDKYFVMVIEKLGRKLEWLDLVKHLFEKYQGNHLIYYIIPILIAMIMILLLS